MSTRWVSWGGLRRALHPLFLRYWAHATRQESRTQVEGFDLTVLPTVFHPKYFGSSAMLARFIGSLELKGKRLLDVGCGSGIISLCAARAGACVTAADINPAAVECASINAERARLPIVVRWSDLFSDIPETFDVIAWNPPFFRGTPQNTAQAAFFGGESYEVIARFTAEVRGHLNPGGHIYTVLSEDADVSFVEELFLKNGFASATAASEPLLLGERMRILCSHLHGR